MQACMEIDQYVLTLIKRVWEQNAADFYGLPYNAASNILYGVGLCDDWWIGKRFIAIGLCRSWVLKTGKKEIINKN
jgi:hypothetical protein